MCESCPFNDTCSHNGENCNRIEEFLLSVDIGLDPFKQDDNQDSNNQTMYNVV